MDKFSILSLSGNDDNVRRNVGSYKTISIQSLSDDNKRNSKYDSSVLLKETKDNRKKVVEIYNDEFDLCWQAILHADKSSVKKIVVYTVPVFRPDCIIYNPIVCLQFIQEKLKGCKIGSYIINETNIFISWHNLEKMLSIN